MMVARSRASPSPGGFASTARSAAISSSFDISSSAGVFDGIGYGSGLRSRPPPALLCPLRQPAGVVDVQEDDDRSLDRVIERLVGRDVQQVPALVGADHPLLDGDQFFDGLGGQL